MKIVKPSYEILTTEHEMNYFLSDIEYAGRTCYKSHDKITETSSQEFVKKIVSSGHHSVIEHKNISVKFICNRGFTHELVRHRLICYSQELTRYCNYSKKKFGKEITVIEPPWFERANIVQKDGWEKAMFYAERFYFELLEKRLPAQHARGVLPIDVKTEIVATANLREWRHIFKLRCAEAAHPSMKQLMIPLCKELQKGVPIIFDDIEV